MKKLSIFSFLFLFIFSLFAQEKSTACSTIVLENNNEIPAFINGIQLEQLYYWKCPDSTSRQYSIPVDLVKFIREPNGDIKPLSTYIVDLPDVSPIKNNDQPINNLNNLIFRQKAAKKVIVIIQEQYIKVVFTDAENKVKKVKGRWEMMTEKELILSRQNKSSLAIPKEDIVKIVVFKKHKGLGKAVWITLLAIGGILSFISILAAIQEADQKNNSKLILGGVASVLFLALIIGGIAAIIFAIKTKTIKYPFKGEWEITAPANEINDVREYYNQP